MQVQVRDAVFETNSSSTHSVTIAENELMDLSFCKENLRNGKVTVPVYYYGWEWARYHTPEEKLAYILSHVARGSEEERRICQVVQDLTGCEVVVDTSRKTGISGPGSEYGSDLAYRLRMPRDLVSFLFSSNSWILTGNDNGGPGEFLRTDLGNVPATPDFVVSEPTFEERMTVTLTGHYDGMRVEVDGEILEVGGDRKDRDVHAFFAMHNALEDVVVLEAEVSPLREGFAPPSREQARDLLFERFVGKDAGASASELGVRILDDVVIEVPAASDAAIREARPYAFDHVYRMVCATTPATIARMREIVAGSQAPRPGL